MDREDWRAAVHGVTKKLDVTYQLNNNSKPTVRYIKMDKEIDGTESAQFSCSFMSDSF